MRRAANILVVDDNPAVLKLIGTLLEDEGMGVTLAGSVREAKAALDASGWSYDLVLSDISMPVETGFDLLQWIKREDSPNRELPVLLTTAQLPEAENRIKGLAMGAVDYVVRPIELSELVLRVVHAVEHFQRVKSLQASLEDSANLALVGRLLAASHHEIKNIATLVRLVAEQTVKAFEPVARDDHARTALRSLSQSTELLADVARSVSSLLAPESAVCRPFDLTKLVREVVELMTPRLRPTWLEVVSSPAPLWAMGHAVRVKQVLINLLLNAADAIAELSPEGGGHVRVICNCEGDQGRIVVEDNGIGFADAGTRSEFSAFSTTKKLRGGQGLGLWLSSTLMRNMGGSLTLASQGVGQGATAVMALAYCEGAEIDISQYLSNDF